MFRQLSRICAVFAVLSALLITAPAAHAGPLAVQDLDGSSWDFGGWIDALRLWLQEALGESQDEPETRMRSVSAGLGGPTGPCIDPQGGTTMRSDFCFE